MYLLWDFNGTLLNDVQTGIESVNVLLRRRGLREFNSISEYHSVFGFPIIDYYRRAGFDFSKESYADVAVEWVEQYMKYSCISRLNEGVKDTLKQIQKKGIQQIVLSATERGMLKRQLKELGIFDYFGDENILGLDNIQAGSKVGIAIEWVKHISNERTLLVGDTEHDYEVAQAAGMECLLIDIGHQSHETLEKCGVPIISSICEVLNYII